MGVCGVGGLSDLLHLVYLFWGRGQALLVQIFDRGESDAHSSALLDLNYRCTFGKYPMLQSCWVGAMRTGSRQLLVENVPILFGLSLIMVFFILRLHRVSTKSLGICPLSELGSHVNLCRRVETQGTDCMGTRATTSTEPFGPDRSPPFQFIQVPNVWHEGGNGYKHLLAGTIIVALNLEVNEQFPLSPAMMH